MEFDKGGMRASDRAANAGVVFHPAVDAADNNGTYAPPCIEIGGVLVFAYVRDGILVVSLDYDGADVFGGNHAGTFAVYGGDLSIPTVVTAGHDTEPVWEALPDNAVTEDDARILRKNVDEPRDYWVLPDWVHGGEG